MKKNVTPVLENIAESTAACLLTMVQGNILAISMSHWLVASQTGAVAGLITSAAIFATSTKNRWAVSILLGIITAIVDFAMHPGNFGAVATEAVVTGFAAALLSYLVGSAYKAFRARQPAIR